jgi:hypothetical protein
VTTDRTPHPSVHTHGDNVAHHLLDRLLTEVEGLRDDFAAAFAKPAAEPELSPSVAIDITEPAVTPTGPRKRAAKKLTPPTTKEVPDGDN